VLKQTLAYVGFLKSSGACSLPVTSADREHLMTLLLPPELLPNDEEYSISKK
jgi:hypothetical protein